MPHPSSASQRTEPRLGGAGPVPLRAPAPRPVGVKPMGGESAPSFRLPGEQRPSAEAGRISLTASERLTVSSEISEHTGPSRGVVRFLALVVLVGLAAVGAVSLLHQTLGGLPF